MVDQRSHLFSYSIFDRKQFLQLTTNLIKIRFRATSTKDSVEDLTASGSPTVDQRKGEPEA